MKETRHSRTCEDYCVAQLQGAMEGEAGYIPACASSSPAFLRMYSALEVK